MKLGLIFSLCFWLALAYWLVSCTTDPHAGMVAARLTGQTHCLAFSREGKGDTAAVFPFNGRRYIYHPSFGSAALPPGDYPPTLCIPGSVMTPVQIVPERADLLNGCLPRAIAQVREHGGRVAFTSINGYGHYYREP